MKKYEIITVLTVCLTGCGNLTAIDHNGNPTEDLVWPRVPEDVKMDNKHGTYGVLANIALIKAGASRDQVYQMIGRPHFSEGFHVREWDYIFHFPQPNGSEYLCQYKVLFNNDKKVAHTYWKAVDENNHCPTQQY